MKKLTLFLLIAILFTMPGCGAEQTDSPADSEQVVYHSDTPSEDCCLCSGNMETMVPLYWGQDNVALISLNTFEVMPVEINRYDWLDGHLIEEATGVASFEAVKSPEGGFSANFLVEYDRGFATGSLDCLNDERVDAEKAASFLCEDCLNQILPQKLEPCFGVGILNLKTKEIKLLEEDIGGFEIGDFYIDCDLMEQHGGARRMSLLIFYCPMRYETEAGL